ncbi:unnamed protein product [Rotaria sp. Silwood1]|nr:unnamed protein product [Rotaria sp. Silwood1]
MQTTIHMAYIIAFLAMVLAIYMVQAAPVDDLDFRGPNGDWAVRGATDNLAVRRLPDHLRGKRADCTSNEDIRLRSS